MKRFISIILLITIILSLSCCKSQEGELGNEQAQVNSSGIDYQAAAKLVSEASGLDMTAVFLESMGAQRVQGLLDAINGGSYSDLTWLEVTDYSRTVIADLLAGTLEADNITNMGFNGKNTFTVSFVGDILFDPDFRPMVHANSMGGVLNCIGTDVVDYLKASDVFLINNEFSVGERGEPLDGKTWTFRVHPSRLSLYKEMGVDIVSLANNHVYDYGIEGFEDTIANLDKAGIPHVGAGMNLGEAAEGYYFVVNGIKVGIVAASCAEKKYFTPVAEEDTPGVLGTYETADFIDAIKAADSQCDILIAYVHWGTENTTQLDDEQIQYAREYIDAGVDAVIGGHTHCLQGMEYYNGKPIIYSVGNFWFNSKSLDSCVITLEIDRSLNTEAVIVPLEQKNCETKMLYGEDARDLFDRVESYEPQGVVISDDGVISPATE